MGRPYWKCIDCGTEINEIEKDVNGYYNVHFEYCFRCNNWGPEVVVGYR